MGFWSRKPVAASDSTSPISAAASSSSNDSSPSSQAQPPAAPAQAPAKSRDDLADEELSAFLKTIQSESDQSSSSSKHGHSTGKDGTFQDTLYPTAMSCREAFDELYFCYSLGGQFKNLYRYGSYRECADKSADFWFCMRTKMYGPVAKKEMIVKYHKEKEAQKYKRGPSSEDVWNVRTEPLTGLFDSADEKS
ncbi:hypothetical protein Dda_3032 [Drechslerella dactyloides]|uniref:Early meiotic induction protein 1 n=1 Tax=Drechslerella dactyloides TaxID=74499 RepID=A0AAD6J523_DREDA|nr:hypothetical protein Dda_3032 [Drechslerella dactyloides]